MSNDDNDGIPSITFDTDGDGDTDMQALDLNQDGLIDLTSADFDGDSVVDRMEVDLDYDGLTDLTVETMTVTVVEAPLFDTDDSGLEHDPSGEPWQSDVAPLFDVASGPTTNPELNAMFAETNEFVSETEQWMDQVEEQVPVGPFTDLPGVSSSTEAIMNLTNQGLSDAWALTHPDEVDPGRVEQAFENAERAGEWNDTFGQQMAGDTAAREISNSVYRGDLARQADEAVHDMRADGYELGVDL